MLDHSVEGRRGALVARLKIVREEYEKCVRDLAPDVANRGSEWSISDLLYHVHSDRFYENMTNRLLKEDNPQFERSDAGAGFQRVIDRTLAFIDDTLAVATNVTGEELARSGTRLGQPYAVIESLEAGVAHFEEHLAQLQNEIRPREGLPSA